ncbi:polysaccharide deacetylase family protein [Streptomyces sp. WMMC940]|uniref:polysaccharide deacetylase family protein n=1 Tax=Streptomyces sp. WMMC940 TaxID=3015153 RepID=UPI0022B607EF|nr:polysaccharide deacetylase family protein [Streptomyces sp. WMMC940]MCZ7456132.1 polysaccharide deacetylase family protein [Streptomyces sp. WMMC940]
MSRNRKAVLLSAVAALAAVIALTATVLWPDRISPWDARVRASVRELPSGAVDCREAKCIALTFDAGPGKDTPRLLDVLKKENVPATFFLLGKNHVVRHPGTVRRIAAEGHEVANHTWSHEILTDRDADVIRRELSLTQEAVERITGHRPTLMRPPQGRTNAEVARICKELGLAQVLWSATAKDYSTTDSALITRRILDAAERDGIILLHDIYDGTVPAVPGIITELKERGYTFVTVPQLLAPGVAEPGEVYKP